MARQLGHAVLASILAGGGAITSIGCAGLVGADFGGYESSAASAAPSSDPSQTLPEGENEDAGADAARTPDAAKTAPDTSTPTSSKKCVGAATACTTYATDMTSCQAQDGCTWQTPACKLTVNCSAFQTNQQCQNAPGCATDFTTSTCKAVAGYCSGTTKAQCETKSVCAFSGGCSGTASPCNGLGEATCKVQAGCSWQ